MKADKSIYGSWFFGSVCTFLCRIPFSPLAYGPIPGHMAFIMDGNRRYAKKRNIERRDGYKAGFYSLICSLAYCFELGIKYVTVYAFSIDNFKRDPEEVRVLMDLIEEKIEELLNDGTMVRKYGLKMNFWGDLSLLTESLRATVEKAMASTAGNTGHVFSVCVAYTSTSEIIHALHESCKEKAEEAKRGGGGGSGRHDDAGSLVSVEDLERHLYSAGCPDPDIVIRTSGETRLSNFLLWQSTCSHLQTQVALWPEFSLRHLAWAILEYQRAYPHMEALRSRAKKHF